MNNKEKLDRLLHLELRSIMGNFTADETTEQNELYKQVLYLMNRMERE